VIVLRYGEEDIIKALYGIEIAQLAATNMSNGKVPRLTAM